MEIEREKRVSESLLWKLQVEAYIQFGVKAWSQKGVPSYLTSNPSTAFKYAKIVFAYIQESLANQSLKREEPLYILDLGAGTGRFGFLFLKELKASLQTLQQPVSICYVMTDIVEQNLIFLQEHPFLQNEIKSGHLDFAYYHHAYKTEKIKLRISNRLLEPVNPLIVIANYFFDTIPQDLFRVVNGKLEEGRITLSSEKSVTDPSIINHLQYQYAYFPLGEENYYPDFPEASEILSLYQKLFDGSYFLFPIGAMESIRYFTRLAPNWMWLAGDQGLSTEDQVKKNGEPKISLHGSFSIAVSYHALAQFFERLGGHAWLEKNPNPLFVVLTAVSGKANQFPATGLAFKEQIEAFSPADYWTLVSEAENTELTLDHLLELIKLGNWDPMNLHAFFEKIRRMLPSGEDRQKKFLVQAIEGVWNNFYPISADEGAFLLNLGVLLYEIGDFEEALKFFERSKKLLTDDNAAVRQNIILCLERLKHPRFQPESQLPL